MGQEDTPDDIQVYASYYNGTFRELIKFKVPFTDADKYHIGQRLRISIVREEDRNDPT